MGSNDNLFTLIVDNNGPLLYWNWGFDISPYSIEESTFDLIMDVK